MQEKNSPPKISDQNYNIYKVSTTSHLKLMIIGVSVQLYYCGTMMVCSLNNDFIFNDDIGKLLYLVSKRCVRGDSSVIVDCERQRVLILLNNVEARRVFQAVH